MLENAERELLKRVEGRGVTRVTSVAAFPDVPGAWIWLCTRTDAERDTLIGDPTIVSTGLSALEDAGFASPDTSRSGVVVQSQETVDRDFEGSWFYAQR